jgi:transposase
VLSRIVWIGRGRDRDTLDAFAFFAKLGEKRAHKLVAVTMDMAQGYISAVQNAAPQADIVFDSPSSRRPRRRSRMTPCWRR